MKKILLLLVVLSFISGCSGKQRQFVFNRDFSINLAQPGKSWLQLEKLSPGEEKAVYEYGMPTYFRIWWDRDGAFKSLLDVDQQLRKGQYKTVKKTWIYPESAIELEFPTPFEYKVMPLTDKLKTLCKHGDPEEVKRREISPGIYEETWIYYSEGKMYKFVGENLLRVQEFPPMGRKIKI